jgi:hypothetical protein
MRLQKHGRLWHQVYVQVDTQMYETFAHVYGFISLISGIPLHLLAVVYSDKVFSMFLEAWQPVLMIALFNHAYKYAEVYTSTWKMWATKINAWSLAHMLHGHSNIHVGLGP